MIIDYDAFVNKLNTKLFEGRAADLVIKIESSPDRYVGLFRPTTPRTKLIQNVTQSHEIKFGDALEDIMEAYFRVLKFEMLPKKLSERETRDGQTYDIDQLFKKGNVVYLIEQKVRDDHDSTKKVGQFSNFEAKYFEVSCKYKRNEVIPIMWFIDDSLKKNKRYYASQMFEMAEAYGCHPKLYYGGEMFSENKDGIKDFPYEMWNEIIAHLTKWKRTLPDMPEINLDSNSKETFEELKDLSPSIYRKLFNNEDIREQILPIIFPKGTVLNMLKNYFNAKEEEVYANISEKIEEYLEETHQ